MRDKDEGGSPLLDYLELVRLPNIFTAIADVAMGFLFVQVAGDDEQTWHIHWSDGRILLLLAATSSLLYAAGVVLNDVADVDIDRNERPKRPIPSGRILLATARRFGWLLLLLGVAVAWIVPLLSGQLRTGLIGSLLAACIVLYDMGLKRTILGPVAMGGCRTLNVLLGMSVLAGPFQPQHWLVAAAIGVFVAGITWFARNESDEQSNRLQLLGATVLMLAGIGLLAYLPHWGEDLVGLQGLESWQWPLVMGLLGLMIGGRCFLAVSDPTPERVQIAVTHAIMSLVILDAAACFAARGAPWAIAVVALIFPTMSLGRFFEST
jgi:4-hydroxybenzoate polyprenyltransferase